MAENISTEINRARDRVAALVSDRARYQELEQSGGSVTAYLAHVGRELFEGDVELGGWRSTLDRNAREVMADLEQKIHNYARDLYADAPYKPPLGPRKEFAEPPLQDPESSGTGWAGGYFVAPGGGAGAWQSPGGFTVPGSAPAEAGDPMGGDGSVPRGDTELAGVGFGPGGAGPLTGPGPATPVGAFVDTPWGRVLAPGGVIAAPPPGAVVTPGAGSAARSPATPGVVPFVPPMVPGRLSGSASPTSGRRSRRGCSARWMATWPAPGRRAPSFSNVA
ncbi:MAG: hypothetical protein K6V36_13905 [Anaerolineae bacterium]|nr:hypothetical protein [Anaerolineae bacterium]